MRSFKKKRVQPKQNKQSNQEDIATSKQKSMSDFQSNILNMQNLVGNQAVMRMMREPDNPTKNLLIQRMPDRLGVIRKLGDPKKHKKNKKGEIKKENSTKYRAVLDSLEVFETYIQSNFVAQDPDNIRTQMVKVNQLLQAVYTAMSAYKKKGAKGKYMVSHRDEVKEFQNIAARAFLEKMDNPSAQHAFLAPSLTSFLNSAQQNAGAPPIQLDADNQTGSARGGTKEMSKFDMENGEEGYFNEYKNTLQSFNSEMNPEKWNELVREINEQVDLEAAEKGWDDHTIEEQKFMRKNALKVEFDIGVQGLGINPEDARMNNRDIAMSRLDQLFNTHLIARVQQAVVNLDDGSQLEGTIMADAGADGAFSAQSVMEEGETDTFSSKQETVDYRSDKIGVDDPELMRQLSRLYLLDLIASQVDRNPANYFIYRGEDGELLGITGIDNDLSFGTGETADIHRQQLNGITRYVDKDLANTIISLDATILEPILSDLLPPNEVQAAVKRMQDLQTELKKDETNLLEPDEWLDHKDAILDENKDYYSSLMNFHIGDTRKIKMKK